MKILKTITLCCLACLSLQATAQPYKLWYDKPALVWTDALPLGNGRLGAMVYGIPATERLQLNEETIWAGQPNKNANPHAKAALPVVQNLHHYFFPSLPLHIGYIFFTCCYAN